MCPYQTPCPSEHQVFQAPLETLPDGPSPQDLFPGPATTKSQTWIASAWKRFGRHRAGFWSLWILATLFLVTQSCWILCNSKPLVVGLSGRILMPALFYYPETVFGAELDLEPDYQSPEFKALLEKQNAWAVWAPIPYDPNTLVPDIQSAVPSAPSAKNWLGTDDQGRDVLTRLLYGLRTSLAFGLSLALVSTFIGVALGAVQGYFGGLMDLLCQRLIEVWSGLPTLFLIMILASAIVPSVFSLFIVMAAFGWLRVAGIARAEFLRLRSRTYVRAAQVLGASSWRILVRHLLPNALGPILGTFPSVVNGSVASLTALDFLGFGLPVGTASLGELLQQARANLYCPWLGITAFCAVALILMLVTFVGQGLRDAFDPRADQGA
jgi:microcin C transport system permease protein